MHWHGEKGGFPSGRSPFLTYIHIMHLRQHSKEGQDIVLYHWIRTVGETNRVAVEFGARDGFDGSNVRMFAGLGWRLVQWDVNQSRDVSREHVTRENVNDTFARHDVPPEPDILSIDVDGNDYWIWEALTYLPRVVVIEYNANFGIGESAVVRYDPNRKWTGDAAYGASFTAMTDLARRKGYVCVDEVGHDLVFVRESLLLPKAVNPTLPRRIHRQTGYDQFTAPTRQIKL